MSNHVDTISVVVSKFSPKLYVQSFELSLAVNSIPTLVLNILPVEPPASGSGQYVTATSPDIDDITKLYSELLKKSLDLKATATIEIRLDCHKPDIGKGSQEYDQSVKLEDWILTDVGLSTVTTKAAPVLTVIFSHPIVKLDRTGSIYEEVKNKGALTRVFKTLSGTDPISYMDALYKVYAGGGSILFYDIAPRSLGGPREQDKIKVKRFRSRLAEHPPGKYIEGKTGGLFLANVASSLLGNIKMATGFTEMPHAFGDSTWSRLVRSLCPSFLTHVVPTYYKPKLSLEPFSPWQLSSRTVFTPVIEAMDVVSADPAPIIGTAVTKDADFSRHVVNGKLRTNTGGGTEYSYTYAFYFPEKGSARADDYGEVLGLGETRVIQYIIDMDHTANAKVNGSAPVGNNLGSAGNGVSDRLRETMDDAYAKAMFLINYRRSCKASITSPLPLFRDGHGNMLHPGRVLTVHTESGPMFHGYITSMVIKGSAEGGSLTRIDLSHARPVDPDSVLVDEGTVNPCYPSIQPLD